MTDSHATSVAYSKQAIPSSYSKIGWGLTAVGLALVVISYIADPSRALFNNIIGFTFLTSIATGALFFVALEYLAGAIWSTPFRRVMEFISAVLPIAIVAAIPLLLNLHGIFHWSHPEAVANDAVLQSKAPYLNETFFYFRFGGMFALWMIFYVLLTRNSVIQDFSKDQRLTETNIKLSTAFIPIFAITVSIFSIDWLMSIEAHWFSTIFGVYFFTGTIIAALAIVTYIVVDLSERGLFFKGIREDHYYSFGALLFGLTSFWAYIAFSQFMLIWYANLPEENFWFIARWNGGWQYVSIAMTLFHFWIPYFMLVSRPSKMNKKNLKRSAVLLVFAHLLDLYWLVMPSYSESPIFSFYELAFPILGIGLIITVFAMRANKYNLIPVGDPKLQRGIDFHL